jgi:hypothetical protein
VNRLLTPLPADLAVLLPAFFPVLLLLGRTLVGRWVKACYDRKQARAALWALEAGDWPCRSCTHPDHCHLQYGGSCGYPWEQPGRATRFQRGGDPRGWGVSTIRK